MSSFAKVPMRWVGPMKLTGDVVDESVKVPLATYEPPVWPSTNRGAKVTRESGGLKVTLIDERMCRSICLKATCAGAANKIAKTLDYYRADFEAIVSKSSRFAKLIDIHCQIIADLLYIRFEFTTGDAAGHNMVTQASDQLMHWLLKRHPELDYVSVSGNFCVDKKNSAVNGILGRGKNYVTEMLIPKAVCTDVLKTSAKQIADLNYKKNYIGSVIAGSLRSANAHYANILLAFYLATGQDAANIVEGSQGFTYAEDREGDLYFSCTIPNIIVGTVGMGKDLDFVQDNLREMGCLDKRAPGDNARRLGALCAATITCCELSLLAALTNPGELMRAHRLFEREHGAIKP
jgi:hydroxymethylglutaryl-CoA reductase (NADPH)